MGGSWWVEIVFLAMLAGFIALRLVSVLGRRTGHEQRPIGDAYRGPQPELAPAAAGPVVEGRARAAVEYPAGIESNVKDSLAAIAAKDAGFDPLRFAEGAKAAYRMILEAFWKGDLDPVEPFMADDVADQFRAAIVERDGGSTTDRLLTLNDPRIVGASLDGMMAEVSVAFDAKIAPGPDADAAQSHDVWTFRRHVATADPNWLLVATGDEE